jgi:hypothetical protein
VGRDEPGPDHQRLGAGRGNATRWVGTALTSGAGNTVRPIRFSNRIKFISNGFKFVPNFDCFKRYLPLLQKFKLKYGWKELEIRNNFPYRNISRFEMEFELKFRELL